MCTCWVPAIAQETLSLFHTSNVREGLWSLSLGIGAAGHIEAHETTLKLQQAESVANPRVAKFGPPGFDLHRFEGLWGQKPKGTFEAAGP